MGFEPMGRSKTESSSLPTRAYPNDVQMHSSGGFMLLCIARNERDVESRRGLDHHQGRRDMDGVQYFHRLRLSDLFCPIEYEHAEFDQLPPGSIAPYPEDGSRTVLL